MSDRFQGLKKIPDQPAARLLAQVHLKLDAPHGLPANADVPSVMEKLDEQKAYPDMLKLMSAALPPRERVWWACLSGRDVAGEGDDVPQTLSSAEAWVFKPNSENYEAAFNALQLAEPDDPTAACAHCAVVAEGKLGPGDMADMDAPPQLAASLALVMAVDAADQYAEDIEGHLETIIDRALDIARGGSGRLDAQ